MNFWYFDRTTRIYCIDIWQTCIFSWHLLLKHFCALKKFLSHGKFKSRVVTSFIFTIILKVFSLGLPVIYKSTPNVPFSGFNNMALYTSWWRHTHGDGATHIMMTSSGQFWAWVLDEVSQIHQVKHVAEIEFLFTFQFIIKYFQSTQDLITQIIIFQIFILEKFIKTIHQRIFRYPHCCPSPR